MVTFRSFSRFVSRYPWGLRMAAFGVALPVVTGELVLHMLWAAPALFLAVASLENAAREERDYRPHVRLVRFRMRREATERARVRSQPLRGWTK